MKVSIYFNDILTMDFIWKHLCKQFSDFERLRFMHDEQELTWRTIYEKRMTDILHTDELKVGYQDEPENVILFQIKGNGHVLMSTEYIGEELDDVNSVNFNGYNFKMDKLVNTLPEVNVLLSMNGEIESFVNISVYSPFLLLLTSNGNVYEFIFEPSYNTVFGENTQHKMRYIAIPKMPGEKSILVKSTPIANYSITNKGRIFAWTTIHETDPLLGTKNITYTEPCLIGQTRPDQKIIDIVYINETHTEFVTKDERIQQLNESLYSTLVLNHNIFN